MEVTTMQKIHKSTHIHAPVEKVFAFMNDPRNLPEVWPAMIETRDLTPSALGGYDFGWTYKMAGMKFEGASQIKEYTLNQRTVTQSTKGIDSQFTWTYKPLDNGTEFTVEVEYKVPIPLIGRLAETLILKQNEHEAETMLDNLKARMEQEIMAHA
jgi:carbon monoxide dehydrogenase subunit G